MPITAKETPGIVPRFGVALLLAVPLVAAPPASVPGQLIAGNTPSFVAESKLAGPVDPAQTIDVSIWLNPHNRGELDQLAQDLYKPSSPPASHPRKTKPKP